MTSRRIAFVEFSPSGGLFQFSAQLGAALAERGHEVHLFTGPRPEITSQYPGFTVHAVLPTWHALDTEVRSLALRKVRRAMRAPRLALAWLLLALVHLRRSRPDIVFWSNWPHSLDSLGVLLVARTVPRVMIGMVAHEPRLVKRSDTTSYKRGPVLDRALPAAWRRVALAFVLSEDARDRLLTNFTPAGPVLTIPHGDESALRNGHPVQPVAATDPVVLFFGTWTAYKGIDVLLDSWAEVRKRVPDARLVLAGGVAGIDLGAVLERAGTVGGVDPRPGYVPREQVPELFQQARAVVTPYLRASQSGVVHLAYTFDRPVIASSVGDIPDVVQDGRTGLLTPPGDRDALTDAIVALLTDPARAARMGDAGARWLAESASWSAVAARVEDGIDKARAQRAARSEPRR
jgi:glycosyltransferase involved in cell wall biosynthesis